jgi:DNA mismatch repair protein MutS
MTASQPSGKQTPLMRQFHAIKQKHPDKILFFRMGDFYEMFGDDAVKAAPILNVALTSRAHGEQERIPLAGVPHHAADRYLARLLRAGLKVVVVEQTEDPRQAKGLVRRDVVEILTPGTATIEDESSDQSTRWLAAVYANGRGSRMGLAALDLSTGAFLVDEGQPDQVIERLRLLDPAEILHTESAQTVSLAERLYRGREGAQFTDCGEWSFEYATAERELNDHFGTSTLDGFGVAGRKLGVTAAGAILRYLRENHRDRLDHIKRLIPFDDDEYMLLDYATVRNLELVENATGGQANTLFSVMNCCLTVSGARRLRQSLLRPFCRREPIERRLSGVAELVRNRDLAHSLREALRGCPDLERLAGRVGIGKINPRQSSNVAQALATADKVREVLAGSHSPHLSGLRAALPDTTVIRSRLEVALVEEPPLSAAKGGVIRRGYSEKLDALNDSIRDARTYIASLQATERQRTGIHSLKVGYNKVFGYYIEVTKANSAAVPEEYIRKQTLVNAERYITPELKEKEELIVSAEEKIFRLELELFEELTAFAAEHIDQLLLCAELLAELDLVSALGELAVQRGYVRPEIDTSRSLRITAGRHPVIETVLPPGTFVSNDTDLHTDTVRLAILTGPNMSGKSTYLRQIGLITIMAQMGSFVPAESATVGLADRVFTRVGASDNLAGGQSTFLVEMVETANILHNATDRSLVLLDEVGRGTSTFDGLSVAWAVVEHINEHNRCRTVFATHYHELTGMSELYEPVHNFQVTVKRWEDRIVFMHQIAPGGCDDSYGVDVARLAGLPRSVVTRARQVLRLLESGKFNRSELGRHLYAERVQPSLFDAPVSEIEKVIRELDVNSMTPIEALNLLRELQEKLK